jgi:hypothetical protein
MRSTVCAMLSKLKETIQHDMKAIIQPIWAELDEMTACNEATETESNTVLIQSIEECWEVPNEEATVKTDADADTDRVSKKEIQTKVTQEASLNKK